MAQPNPHYQLLNSGIFVPQQPTPQMQQPQEPFQSASPFVVTMDANTQATQLKEEALANIRAVLCALNPNTHGPQSRRSYQLVVMTANWVAGQKDGVRWGVVSGGEIVMEGPASTNSTDALSKLWQESARMVSIRVPKAWDKAGAKCAGRYGKMEEPRWLGE